MHETGYVMDTNSAIITRQDNIICNKNILENLIGK